MCIGFARQTGVGIAGESDQSRALTLDQRHDGEEFSALAGIRQGDKNVVARHHAQIAMAGLGRMDKIRRCSSARHGRGDFARNMP